MRRRERWSFATSVAGSSSRDSGAPLLIFVRHGESSHNAAGRLVGRSDPLLTSRGSEQATAISRLLSREPERDRGTVLVSSPLQRARATARAIADELDLDVLVDPRLIELDYGELDGSRLSEVASATWASWRSDPAFRPAGGETLLEVQRRVSSFCEEHAAHAALADVIAVSHVSPIKAAACWALGVEPALTWRLSLPVASITRIVTEPRALRSFGETAHLLDVGLHSEPPPGHMRAGTAR